MELDNLADLLLRAHLALVQTLVPRLRTTERGGVCLVKESNNRISPVILKLTPPSNIVLQRNTIYSLTDISDPGYKKFPESSSYQHLQSVNIRHDKKEF